MNTLLEAVKFEDDVAIRFWRGRLGRSFDFAYRTFRLFYLEVLSKEFVGFRPAKIVEWQSNALGRDRYRILGLAQEWINNQPLRYSTKKLRLSHIRSFFMHNMAELPFDRSFRFHSDVPPVLGKLSLEALKRIILNSNPMYRAIFLMMAQGLMGESELVYVSNHYCKEIVEHLTKNDGEFMLVLPGRKQNRNVKNFCTVLSTKSDWADAMRDYLKSLPSVPSDVLFKNSKGNPLTEWNIWRYFRWRAVESGVSKRTTPSCSKCKGETVRKRARYHDGSDKVLYKCRECGNVDWACELGVNFGHIRTGINPHEIRDLMRTRWESSGANTKVAEFMMGHTVDANEYLSWMKYEKWKPIQEYRKALAWLNIVSGDPNKVDRNEIDKELEGHKAETDVLRREVADLRHKLDDSESQRNALESRVMERLEEVEKESKRWQKKLQ